MRISWYIYAVLLFAILLLVADDTKSTLWQTEIDSNDMNMSHSIVQNSATLENAKSDDQKQQAHFMRNRPITQKTQPAVEQAEIKGGVSLGGIVEKYIQREEKQHYSSSEQKNDADNQLAIESTPSDANATKPVVILDGPSIEEDSSLDANKSLKKQAEQRPSTHQRVMVSAIEANVTKDDNLSQKIAPIEIKPPQVSKPKSSTIAKKSEIVHPKYKVKKGDTLIMIAMRYSVESKDIAKINNLGEKRHIRIGQKLKIPMKQKRFDIITQARYTVESGDSLGWIAKHFNVGLKDLKKYNKLEGKAHIRIGQKLILPLPHKLAELKRKAEKERRERLRKKRERARLARIALNKREERRFGKLSSKRKITVHATAYTSHTDQTDSTPFLAAWSNPIRPGMKIVAVSRDLITKYGITNGSKIRISGLRGVYTVRDKMNKKWRKRVDIYMGTNRRRALRWGKRRVSLYY